MRQVDLLQVAHLQQHKPCARIVREADTPGDGSGTFNTMARRAPGELALRRGAPGKWVGTLAQSATEHAGNGAGARRVTQSFAPAKPLIPVQTPGDTVRQGISTRLLAAMQFPIRGHAAKDADALPVGLARVLLDRGTECPWHALSQLCAHESRPVPYNR